MSNDALNIHWFRQDLRLEDNPSLCEAISKGRVLPIYILDDINSAKDKLGSASRWWLHHSLVSLNKSLEGRLSIYSGDALEIIKDLSLIHI